MSKHQTLDAARVIDQVTTQAAQKKSQEVRRLDVHVVGRVLRQGDVYVHCVATDHPSGQPLSTRQLARGVTRGSRHVAQGGVLREGTTLPPWCDSRRAVLGPAMILSRRTKVTHPEHAWLDLPAGTYQVTLQRDARTGNAVAD